MISFIYFDVGGVLIKDFTANDNWRKLEKELGIKEKDSQSFVEFWDEHEETVCKGQDVEYLLSLAKQKFGLKIPEDYSIMDSFVNKFEKNESIQPLVKKSKDKFKVGLLTNMYPGMLKRIFRKGIMPNIEWDVVVDSSLEGVAKPDSEIFKLAEERSGYGGDEILFIDNGKRHVEAAKNFGWQSFWYDSADLKGSTEFLSKFLL